MDARAEVQPERRVVIARWTGLAGRTVGYQIFDPDTDMFISEGEWRGSDAADGAVEIQLPPERGRYHVYVSPVDEERGWDYASGGQFLLVEATVEQARATLDGSRVTTLAGLRRRRWAGAARKALLWPWMAIASNWRLIRSMVRRDILARYRGSVGGAFWTVLNPLLLMATYYFVFGVVLQARFAGDPSRSGFVLYFLAGMLPWVAFSEALGRSPSVVLEHRNFVKKLVFPVEILPVNLVVAGLVTELLALGVFLLFLIGARGGVGLTALWVPAILVPQMLFTLGLAWFLSATGVYVRDLGQVIGFALTLWFFLTPICYPETALPSGAAAILTHNPIYVLVRAYRAVLLEGRAPDWSSLGWLTAASLVMFIAGYGWFHKLRKSFADVL
jgi:lipopolysaccharide transport system permease protein